MLEIIISIICVSIDGFFTGLAYKFKNTKININNLVIISLMPIIMAYPVMFLGSNLYINNNYIKIIGSILFLILGVKAFIDLREEKECKNINLISSLFIGLSIGLDSSVCAFTLALENANPFITPLFFGISHFILIFLGNNILMKNNINFLKFLSPILFFILALVKLY